MHRYTQVVIIKLFTLALILIYPTPYHLTPPPPPPPSPPYQGTICEKVLEKPFSKLGNRERLFDQKDINAQVATFNETILNVFRNYVPNKHIAVDDKDPVWRNETIKSKIQAKNVLYKKKGRFESDFVCLENLIIELKELISSTKALYCENLAKKLHNPLLQEKVYWSILKTFQSILVYSQDIL